MNHPHTDDRTFVAAFGAIDRAIINPVFMVTGIFGALYFTAAAAMSHLSEDVFGWIAAGIVTSRAGERAGVIGEPALAIGHVLAPESIDRAVERAAEPAVSAG